MLWRRSRVRRSGFALPSIFVSPCHHEAVRGEKRAGISCKAHVDGLNKCATQQLSRRRLSAGLAVSASLLAGSYRMDTVLE